LRRQYVYLLLRGNRMSLSFPRWRAVMGALVLALCLLMLSGAATRAQAACGPGDFVPHQVIVKLNPIPGATARQINATYRTTTRQTFPGSTDVRLLKLPTGSDVTETVKQMANDSRLRYAEPNFFAQPVEGGARHRAWGVSDVAPTSEDYAAQALGLVSAHAISQGEGITVAVVDTGAQLDHPALVDNFEGVKRYDFVDNDTNPSDRPVGNDEDCDGEKDEMVGHGTHVAGIVDITAPAAKIMPLRVLDTEGYGDVFSIAKAIYFAEHNRADVINLSLGSPSRSKLLQEVIKDATASGVLVAAAAGNSNSSLAHYPAAGNGVAASADGLVAVTSVNMYDQKSDFANYGMWVDIAAPGEGIRSTFPVSEYAYWSGTSMATPFVSGQAALIHAVYGSVDPAGMEERIRCSARPLLATDPIYAAMLGAGRADVGASLSPAACP
jgi:subtilisin family serine protease